MSLPIGAAASTIQYRTDAELAALSDRIVHARVLSVQSELDPDGTIFTVSRLAVLEDLTGYSDSVIEVRELGGEFGGFGLSVHGAAVFEAGREVLVCLERLPTGRFRSVAMGFSQFAVIPSAASGGVLLRGGAGAHILGSPPAPGGARTVEEFRQIVRNVRGTIPVAPEGAAQLVPNSVSGNFTLLGGGLRWYEADAGVPVNWYMNADAPAPVTVGNGESEIQTALAAWTAPATASLTLQYAGPFSLSGASPVCPLSGAGVITFEDPTNLMSGMTLAIGGGCYTTSGAQSINGQVFNRFTSGYVIFQDNLSSTYRTPLNFGRIMEHEIGHAIGLGHTSLTGAAGVTNIMYPSCCYSTTPTPPALGFDDVAGLEFIYPVSGPACSYTVTPASEAFDASGGAGLVTVSTSAGCTWSAAAPGGWLTIASGASGTGSGTVTYTVSPNTTPTGRTDSLTVAGHPIAVTQAGVSCTFTVAPAMRSFGAAGGVGTATVSAIAGCVWNAATGAGWVTVAAGASGNGAGTVTFDVAGNAGAARSGALSIAGQTVTVLQSAAGANPDVRRVLDLNGDRQSDVFAYNGATGAWFEAINNGSDFTVAASSWSPNWRVQAGDFNGDGVSDFFLYNEATGMWFKASSQGNGSFSYFQSMWSPGWQTYVIDLNGDRRSDVFVYSPASGRWFRCLEAGAGDFGCTGGSWSPGWDVHPVEWNGDGRTDLFLYNPANGLWFRATNDGASGFTYEGGAWSPGWTIHPGDYSGDGRSDLFVYHPSSGLWFQCLNTESGFSYTGGQWSPGWTVHRARLNGDQSDDLFVYNAANGLWFQCFTTGGGGFATFAQGTWSPQWQVHVTDFDQDGLADLFLYNDVSGQWFRAMNAGTGSFAYGSGSWTSGATIVAAPISVP